MQSCRKLDKARLLSLVISASLAPSITDIVELLFSGSSPTCLHSHELPGFFLRRSARGSFPTQARYDEQCSGSSFHGVLGAFDSEIASVLETLILDDSPRGAVGVLRRPSPWH